MILTPARRAVKAPSRHPGRASGRPVQSTVFRLTASGKLCGHNGLLRISRSGPMPRTRKNPAPRPAQVNKYDANHTALQNGLRGFRRPAPRAGGLADRSGRAHGSCSRSFAGCVGLAAGVAAPRGLLQQALARAQRLRRQQNGGHACSASPGAARMEETALLFLRNNRSLPSELAELRELRAGSPPSSRPNRSSAASRRIERWLLPSQPAHLDAPRAHLRVLVRALPDDASEPGLHDLGVEFTLFRPRSGEKPRTAFAELIDLAGPRRPRGRSSSLRATGSSSSGSPADVRAPAPARIRPLSDPWAWSCCNGWPAGATPRGSSGPAGRRQA
jgi:hypothetical protein